MSRRHHEVLRLAVDLVILTVRDRSFQVLLIERGNPPFAGQLALPGGFLRPGESLEEAAARELLEETALDAGSLHLEQVGAYGHPDRDPRGRVVSVPYLAIAPNLPTPVAGSDAIEAQWRPVEPVLASPGKLAFDHDDILRDAVEQARRQLEYTTLATRFCGETFTIGELRDVYDLVWGMRLDPRNFNRKVTRTDGFLLPTDAKRTPETGRPATLYRRGPPDGLHPPMLRGRDLS
ncbi:NUDIX domain-containing protein [Virgisporangium aurantiacum]